MRSIFGLLISLALASYPGAQSQEAATHTPSQNAVTLGAKIFRSHCSDCHGLNGEGGRGPDLTRDNFRHGATDEALFRTITNGIPGTQMPVSYFPPDQIWQLVAYVKSLSHADNGAPVPGNAASGAKLFRKNGCPTCHLAGGEGGRLGPDLSDIGSIRSPAYLRKAITDPNAESTAAYRAVRIVEKNGKHISGVRLNEDTYSIQIMDYQENLRSFLKRNLSELDVSKDSPMPAFSRLPPVDLDDLTAYLCSLKKKAAN
jgi:cytochrome c oxidase cbb3-type subunit III